MLVLGRHENQSIRIHTSDGIIEILVTKLTDNHVRLGIEAPASIAIYRSEIDPSLPDNLPGVNSIPRKKGLDGATQRGIKFFLRHLGLSTRGSGSRIDPSSP